MSVSLGPDNRPRPVISPFAFPDEEHRQRVARARAAMAAQGIDALLVTEERNFFYFEVAALVSHARCVVFRESSGVGEVRTYDGLGTPVVQDALVRLIAEAAPGARTIGMELGYEQRLGMSVADYEALKVRLPQRQFTDASGLLWGLRMIKSPAELARIERAVRITDSAYRTVFPTLRPGMTEWEIAARFQEEMARLGASASWLYLQSGTYDRGGLLIRDRMVQAGEMVWVDMGANVLGYYADFSRAAVLGSPTTPQREMQQKVREVTQLTLEAVQPGVSIAEVARVCDREMAKRGLTFNTWGVRYGHGMGLQVAEPPHLASYDETVAAPGMVLALEPGMWSAEGRFQVEENLVVTEGGVRCLTECPRELFVVPR